jgi:hypothetical protein
MQLCNPNLPAFVLCRVKAYCALQDYHIAITEEILMSPVSTNTTQKMYLYRKRKLIGIAFEVVYTPTPFCYNPKVITQSVLYCRESKTEASDTRAGWLVIYVQC